MTILWRRTAIVVPISMPVAAMRIGVIVAVRLLPGCRAAGLDLPLPLPWRATSGRSTASTAIAAELAHKVVVLLVSSRSRWTE